MKMSRQYKYITTFSLFFCYFAYGVNFYIVGPTLIELSGLFQTTIEQICLIYTVRSAGYTFGSLSGFLFKYVNRQLMFVFFMILMGITVMLMPHCGSLTYLFVLAGINGFSIGSFDTAINVWVLEIWAEESGPYMQALHFTYGIGSFVAPLICEPFLSSAPIHGSHGPPPASTIPTTIVTSTPSSIAPISITSAAAAAAGAAESLTDSTASPLIMLNDSNLIDLLTNIDQVVDPVDYLIYIPYSIAGSITIFSALIVLSLYYYKKYEPPLKHHKSRSNSKMEMDLENYNSTGTNETSIMSSSANRLNNNNNNNTHIKRKIWDRMPPFLTIWLVLMGSLFLTFFVGMEQMHLQFLPTFAVNTDLELSPSTAAMMSSAAAFAFTIGRCLSIPLAIKLKPHTILYANHILMLCGTIILAIYANNSETMLWVGNIVLGCGFSSVYASIYAFLEQNIRVTNRIGSLFVFAGGLTAALSPSVVGQYIEANPLILVWFNLVCCLLCLTILIIIHLTIYLNGKKPVKIIIAASDLMDDDMKEKSLSLLTGSGVGFVAIPADIVDSNEDTTTTIVVIPAISRSMSTTLNNSEQMASDSLVPDASLLVASTSQQQQQQQQPQPGGSGSCSSSAGVAVAIPAGEGDDEKIVEPA